MSKDDLRCGAGAAASPAQEAAPTASHTPAPWSLSTVTTKAGRNKVALRSAEHHICNISIYNERDSATARLIAAAPAMLKALKHTTALLVDMHIATNGDDDPTELRNIWPGVWNTIDQARAAITAATKG